MRLHKFRPLRQEECVTHFLCRVVKIGVQFCTVRVRGDVPYCYTLIVKANSDHKNSRENFYYVLDPPPSRDRPVKGCLMGWGRPPLCQSVRGPLPPLHPEYYGAGRSAFVCDRAYVVLHRPSASRHSVLLRVQAQELVKQTWLAQRLLACT